MYCDVFTLLAWTSRCVKYSHEHDTHHNVPSTSKTIPFNGGESLELACGLRGANRFGFLVVDAMDMLLRVTKQMLDDSDLDEDER